VLEVEDFVHVVSGILERNDFAIKRKILDMLNMRLAQKVVIYILLSNQTL